MDAATVDQRIRSAAFQFLQLRCPGDTDLVTWRVLTQEFVVDGRPVPLIGQRGIWKPAAPPELPISFSTTPPKPGRQPPYLDEVTGEGLLLYRYQGDNPAAGDNVRMRRAMEQGVPLIYFYGITKGWYLPVWPVFVVGDDPAALTFTVAVDEPASLRPNLSVEVVDEARRRYFATVTRRRLHQATFRERVLRAYGQACAICRLRQQELLEAAHIVPDRDPRGDPVVPNGLALCTIHHAAFDRHVLGIRPDYVVEIRSDVLGDDDGPMLRHGLQGFQGARLHVPHSTHLRPDRDRLEERYEEFRRAG